MTTHKVDWYGEEVRLVMRNIGMQGLVAIGYQVVAHAEANIVGNNQVDTGFMLNSGYVSAPEEDSYSAAKSAAEAQNPWADMGPKIKPPNRETVVVVFGASYTIFQELRRSFFMKAVEQVQGEVAEAEIETVAKRNGLRG